MSGSIMIYIHELAGWWFETSYFSIQLETSSSHLTNSYFSEGLKPPSRNIPYNYIPLRTTKSPSSTPLQSHSKARKKRYRKPCGIYPLSLESTHAAGGCDSSTTLANPGRLVGQHVMKSDPLDLTLWLFNIAMENGYVNRSCSMIYLFSRWWFSSSLY